MNIPTREQSMSLLRTHIKNEALVRHCRMVAGATAAYAKALGENEELWYAAGLLHDLDWETHPDAHPNHALNNLLHDYPQEVREAIAAHAPDRTGKHPETKLEKYLFACDELSGFMYAVARLRPNAFADMEPKSVKKKLKDASFAAQVSRADIEKGTVLINKSLDEHIQFLIDVFDKMEQ